MIDRDIQSKLEPYRQALKSERLTPPHLQNFQKRTTKEASHFPATMACNIRIARDYLVIRYVRYYVQTNTVD
jgi:hypothetical protein